jgi:hypothetical protein
MLSINHSNEIPKELVLQNNVTTSIRTQKKILMRQKIQLARLSRFRIFENVNDLWINEKLYSDVTGTCRLSLQDRKQMTLEEQI